MNNLKFYLTYQILIQTALYLYNFQKQKKNLDQLRKISNAQKDLKKYGTGINRNERIYQILQKYIIHQHCKLQAQRKQNNPMNNLLQMQQLMNNPNQMPQMPNFQQKDLLIRFAPTILGRIVFQGKSPYLFYSPWLEKMIKKESSDPTIKLIVLLLTIGKQPDDTNHDGYITRFPINFIFTRLFRKLLQRIFYRGISVKQNMFKQLQLQDSCQKYEQKRHGEKDLLKKYPDLGEISEVEVQNDDVSCNNQESSASNSKI